ncbi:MAG: hypothetical protein HY053_07700 [Proteobacteria bacterium]|nr:hypothetical protein [Pseudomonadota bacterium]
MPWLFFTILGAFVAYGIHHMSREARRMDGGEKPSFFGPKAASTSKNLPATEMAQCTTCQAYVIKNAVHCGRENCPYPSPQEKA